MDVLVTGGNGFLGHYVTTALKDAGHTPIIFDRRWIPETNLHQVLGDVRDSTEVSESVARVQGVIHLAGVLGTQETIHDPWPALETNVGGSLHVFKACADYKVPCAYITVGNHWMQNSYAITKTCAERFAWMANKEWGAQIAVVRALNAYGPGQKSHPVRKIIPSFIERGLRGQSIQVYGDGLQVMDMIHARDVADILVRALQCGPHPEGIPYEAGTGRTTTVREIAEMVALYTGSHEPIVYLPMRPGEPVHAVVLGKPSTLTPLYQNHLATPMTLETGLAETVEWYMEHR